MEDALFSVVLFFFVFIFYSWLFYTPESATVQALFDMQVKEMLDEVFEVTPEPAAAAVGATPAVESRPEIAPTPPQEVLQGIDVEKLKLRDARKVCKALGIQQKVNCKDAPVSWMRAQIKERLKEEPEKIALIRNVLAA